MLLLVLHISHSLCVVARESARESLVAAGFAKTQASKSRSKRLSQGGTESPLKAANGTASAEGKMSP
jgi:hypothetical protein